MTTATSTRAPHTAADRRRSAMTSANAQAKAPARPTQAMQRRLVARLVG